MAAVGAGLDMEADLDMGADLDMAGTDLCMMTPDIQDTTSMTAAVGSTQNPTASAVVYGHEKSNLQRIFLLSVRYVESPKQGD